MYLLKPIILFLFSVPATFSLLQIDGNEIFDLKSNVLLIDQCSRNYFNTQCTDFCNYKVINSFKSFKYEEESLSKNYSLIKINRDNSDANIGRRKNDVDQSNIFLLTDKNVTYRLLLSKKLDTNIYIFNNKTRDKSCTIWILNLELTDLRPNSLDLEYVSYIENLFQNYTNEKKQPRRNAKSSQEFSTSEIEVSTMVKFPEELLDNSSAKLVTHEEQMVKPRSINRVNAAPISIETSVRSDLLLKTGTNPKVVFEVTNNMEKNIFVIFSVRDEKSVLVNLIPRQTYMMPGQTLPVTVMTRLPQNLAAGFSNTITLLAQAQGSYKAEKSALMQMSPTRTQDTWKPSVKYQFTTGCFDVSTGNCQSASWSLEIKAQDKESGLLQLNSIPFGMNIPKDYVSGTKEWVTGYYSDTCCNPYIEVYAIDLNNNKQTYKLDANDLHLSDASIAAIVIAVVLLIVLIVICAICIKSKYYSDSRDLPTYRGEPR